MTIPMSHKTDRTPPPSLKGAITFLHGRLVSLLFVFGERVTFVRDVRVKMPKNVSFRHSKKYPMPLDYYFFLGGGGRVHGKLVTTGS